MNNNAAAEDQFKEIEEASRFHSLDITIRRTRRQVVLNSMATSFFVILSGLVYVGPIAKVLLLQVKTPPESV